MTRLKALRLKRGLSRTQLAKRAKISVSTIKKLELNDGQAPTLDTLFRLLVVLDTYPAEFFSGVSQYA